MHFDFPNILLVGSLLLLICILLSKPSTNYGIPSLLIFLGIGMAFGNGGPYDFYFNAPKITESLGSLSLVFILFSGGMGTKWTYIRKVLYEGLSLATFGVLITMIVIGIFIHAISPMPLLHSLLLGAIVSSTDAAAVFSIINTQKITLKQRISRTLELESGANDPMVFFLTAGITALILHPAQSPWLLVPSFFLQMTLGAGMGFLFGRFSVFILRHVKLDIKGLYPVLIISLVLLCYSLTQVIYGSGFLAVYITGMVIGNQEFEQKTENVHFFQGISWLMQVSMFLILGLQVFPEQMIKIADTGLLISFMLIFIARPVSVALVLAFFRAGWRKILLVSWVGLKGATPIIFAIYPAIHGVKESEQIFNIVFFVVLSSAVLQGTSIKRVASWLSLLSKN